MSEADRRYDIYIHRWAEARGISVEEVENNLIVKEYREWVRKELEDKEKADNVDRRKGCDT